MGYAVDYDAHGNEILVPGIPMWPDQPKKKLSIDSLKEGDVLIWASNPRARDKTHQVIREATQGATTHAGIYVGGGDSIDATKRTGVDCVRVPSLLEKYEVCYILRWEGIPDEYLKKVVSCAKEYIGFRYAKLDALLLPIRRYALKGKFSGYPRGILKRVSTLALYFRHRFPPKNAVYCSQMVVETYFKIGLFELVPENRTGL